MASSVSGVWAIDIGSNALKALHLVPGAEGLEVVGFDYIEHGRILSAGGIDDEVRQRVIGETLHAFSSRNDVGKDEVAISVAGQNSFARFIKLPPVEKKRIPEIVQFEAVQQIPFDINEVEWDWQIMENPDSPDTEVGIFAIKNEIVNLAMDHFGRENMKIACVQLSPVALYNYALCDIKDIGGFNEKATIVLDMGAENTTLVVCSRTGMWQRSIRIGGNTFTEAIADAFNLSFQKAEKLKRTAPMSKYMRQIFTAMKPVFTDLGSEIQRSLGFYSSSGPGREKGFARMVALGGGMKLQGLAKYLQQTLSIPVVKPDTFERLPLNASVSAAKFHENVSDFGIVYGLGAQLLGEARIGVNLLPRKLARAMAWRRKSRMFTAAAGLLLVVSVLGLVRANIDRGQYKGNEDVRRTVQATISQAQAAQSKLSEQQGRAAANTAKITKEMEKFKYREIVPAVNQMIMACLPNSENNPVQADMYDALAKGDVDGVLAVRRED
ncbi:MAG: type IV pilus assembly protein PilM, partial [Phycisphaerae bacterium]|nr:type IV pilus assembly protein PilM [Phycisphaerae bacterium]